MICLKGGHVIGVTPYVTYHKVKVLTFATYLFNLERLGRFMEGRVTSEEMIDQVITGIDDIAINSKLLEMKQMAMATANPCLHFCNASTNHVKQWESMVFRIESRKNAQSQ